MSVECEDIPHELTDTFRKFETSLDSVQEVIQSLFETPRNKCLQDLTPLEVAKLDLVSVYSINALFWTYLITQGVNPRVHPIKNELDRIRLHMAKVKEIEDKDKAPKLEKEAAKRFVRNAMFDLEDKKCGDSAGGKSRKLEDQCVLEDKERSGKHKRKNKAKNKKRKKMK